MIFLGTFKVFLKVLKKLNLYISSVHYKYLDERQQQKKENNKIIHRNSQHSSTTLLNATFSDIEKNVTKDENKLCFE